MTRDAEPADATDAVARTWSTYEAALRRAAIRMTDDRDEQNDLLQEALVALWLADPTRFDLRDRGERCYLRRMMVNRMWKVRNAEREFDREHHS